MSWIDEEFKKREQAQEERQKRMAEEAARERAISEVVLPAWQRLVTVICADVERFNKHSVKRVWTSVTDNALQVQWDGETDFLVELELDASKQRIVYSAPAQPPHEWKAHTGSISIRAHDGAPALFAGTTPSATEQPLSYEAVSELILRAVLFR